jgi:hypothetical protein
MTFLRAAEQGRLTKMERCVFAYPHLDCQTPCGNARIAVQKMFRDGLSAALSFVHARGQAAGVSGRIALRLSNLLGVDFDEFPQAVGPLEGRVLYDAVHRGKQSCEEALRRLTGTDIMLWAPTDNSVLAPLTAAINKNRHHALGPD